MSDQRTIALDGLTLQFHGGWRPKLTGYIDRHGFTYGYETQTLHRDQLTRKVESAKSIPKLLIISHESKKINERDAFETFGVAPVAGGDSKVLIRRVNFVRRQKYDLVDVQTCWFASPPTRMQRMLTASDEVLASFTFETGPVFPDSWISHYRRFDVDGEGSEFVIYRLRPRHPVGDQEIYQDDWCSQYGLKSLPKASGFTTRKVAGVDAREISFLKSSPDAELLGARVFLPWRDEVFVFQLVTSGRHFSIERGRFEQVLSSIRLGSRSVETKKPAAQPRRLWPDADAYSSDVYDLEARREALPWEADPRGRTALEMRVMLRTLACVKFINSRKSAVYRFMRRRCIWVLEQLDVEYPDQALAQQHSLFKQSIEALPKNFDFVARTALAKPSLHRVLTCPSGDTHIGTLARVAVALECPLFGFDTCREPSRLRGFIRSETITPSNTFDV